MTERFLHFLKELPDKYLLIIVLLIMLAVAIRFGAIEPREIWLLVRDITIAIISIAGYKRLTHSPEISAEVKTDSLTINQPSTETPIDKPIFHEEKKGEN